MHTCMLLHSFTHLFLNHERVSFAPVLENCERPVFLFTSRFDPIMVAVANEALLYKISLLIALSQSWGIGSQNFRPTPWSGTILMLFDDLN